MNTISHYKDSKPYVTQDGSEIRELMHPSIHGNKSQSLAEASIKPGKKTLLHSHIKSEEIYFILQGEGDLELESEIFHMDTGDSICIAPGTKHRIKNTGGNDLKILCCCSPAYSHEDTVISQA